MITGFSLFALIANPQSHKCRPSTRMRLVGQDPQPSNLRVAGNPRVMPRPNQQAFTELKDLFINAPILAHFEEDRETVVEADASGWATGAVLSQYGPDRQLRPCAYLSQKLSPAESNYEIHDKELLAIIRALREWRPELKMVPRFTIVTDHKNLRYFSKAQHLNERQMRWADLLTEFDFELQYRPGKLAARPDALSRRSQDTPKNFTDERLSNRFRTLLKKVQIKAGGSSSQPVEAIDLDFETDVALFEEPELQAAHINSTQNHNFKIWLLTYADLVYTKKHFKYLKNHSSLRLMRVRRKNAHFDSI